MDFENQTSCVLHIKRQQKCLKTRIICRKENMEVTTGTGRSKSHGENAEKTF